MRTDRPLSLAGAFEKPVRGEGLMSGSAAALEQYAKAAYQDFCSTPAKSYIAGQYLNDMGERMHLDKLAEMLGEDAARMVLP